MTPQDDWDEHDVRSSHGGRFEDDVLGLRRVTEHDESLADDLVGHHDDEAMFRPRRRRRRNPLLKTLALLLAGALVVAASVYGLSALRAVLPDVSIGGTAEPEDFEGAGTGEVLVEIPEGAGGGQIAEILAAEGVVASAAGFTTALQADPDAASIQPGTYRMANQMSYSSAMSRLLDGSYREINGVTIREGLWVDETFGILAEGTGHEVADYEAVDPGSLGLPEAADGELEGFLFPSTYEFAEDSTPQEQLQTMVDLGRRTYAELGVPDDELHDVLTKASIVQGEAAFADDLPKVARVVENRLRPGNEETGGKLQMDSTIHFIKQERGKAGTTDADREVDSPYNTYLYAGLPQGPINSPGAAAIEAVMNPTPGDWLYFVTVDPSTGETKFAETFAEHEQNRADFQQWCQENTDESGQC